MTIGNVELEGIRAKYFSIYDINGEHIYSTTPHYDTELLGYTDSTVTVRIGEDINVYDDVGNLIKTTEDNRLESCITSNKTPKFKIDKSIFKPEAIKPVKNAYTSGDTSHTQQTMREAKQRDTEKRAKGIAKQKAILKAKMIKAIFVALAILFSVIFAL